MWRRRRRRRRGGRVCQSKKSDAIWRKIFPSSSFAFPSPFRALNHKILIALTWRQGLSVQEQKNIANFLQLCAKKILDNFSRILAEVNCCRIFFDRFSSFADISYFPPHSFFQPKNEGNCGTYFLFLRDIRYFTWLHPLEKHKPSKPPTHLTKLHTKSHGCISYKKNFFIK